MALLTGIFLAVFLLVLLVQKILVRRRRHLNIKGKSGALHVFRVVYPRFDCSTASHFPSLNVRLLSKAN